MRREPQAFGVKGEASSVAKSTYVELACQEGSILISLKSSLESVEHEPRPYIEVDCYGN